MADVHWLTPYHHIPVLIVLFLSFLRSWLSSCTPSLYSLFSPLHKPAFTRWARSPASPANEPQQAKYLHILHVKRHNAYILFPLWPLTLTGKLKWTSMGADKAYLDVYRVVPSPLVEPVSQLGDSASPPVPAEVFQKYTTLNILLPYRSPLCRLRMMLTPEEQVVSDLKGQCDKIDHRYDGNPCNCYQNSRSERLI